MTTPAQATADLYARLKPAAIADANQYIMSRTPAELQALMQAQIDADLDPPPDPTHAVVANGATLPVRLWDNSLVNGTATVAGGAVTQVAPVVVATKAIIANAAAVPVQNAAGVAQAGSPATATVTAGALSFVKLTV